MNSGSLTASLRRFSEDDDMLKKLHYNSPVMLTFALVSLALLILNYITGGWTNAHFFSVYRAPLTDLLMYPRLFLHVLGHADYQHYIGNMLLLLVIGPPLEEKYGARNVIFAFLITAFVCGAVQWIFFPGTALLGASGLVFMMIVLSSLSGMRKDSIPVTLIFVLIFYLGKEIIDGLFTADNIAQLTHIIGGACGAVLGLVVFRKTGGKDKAATA
jgi:membrane associated rhomboid family serine protease